MAYTWTNGEVITAEKLNQTGDNNLFIISTDDSSWYENYESVIDIDKSSEEISEAVLSGKTVILKTKYAEFPGGQQYQYIPMTDFSLSSSNSVLSVSFTYIDCETGDASYMKYIRLSKFFIDSNNPYKCRRYCQRGSLTL